MQAYGQGFARVYNARWSNFARQVAPHIIGFYESTLIGRDNKSVLDLCCGAGHLAVHLLEAGYAVTGVDLSEHMLDYAAENTRQYLASGQARFIQADAGEFSLDEHFGLVVSTYDSLNHLEDEQTLFACFKCVYAVCDGYFIFDLNTRKGLKNWNGIQVDDGSDDAMIVKRGIFDDDGVRATMRISGFVETQHGLYERFSETVYNTAFNMARVREALSDIGWKNVYFARIGDLSSPLSDPEKELRVFIVAHQ